MIASNDHPLYAFVIFSAFVVRLLFTCAVEKYMEEMNADEQNGYERHAPRERALYLRLGQTKEYIENTRIDLFRECSKQQSSPPFILDVILVVVWSSVLYKDYQWRIYKLPPPYQTNI